MGESLAHRQQETHRVAASSIEKLAAQPGEEDEAFPDADEEAE